MALIGLAAGVMSGLFGIGGGVIIVPLLILVLGFTAQQAAGTSLAALLLPVMVFILPYLFLVIGEPIGLRADEAFSSAFERVTASP